MPDPKAGSGSAGEQSFEACLAELQELVGRLEEGALGLEESIAGFERGVSLLRYCYRALEQAEQRIEILTGFDRSGNPLTAPFEAPSTLEASQPATNQRGKKTVAAAPQSKPEPEPGPELSLPDEGQLF